ncbi:DUF4145 domain-containing protein [Nonomuraea africana]|uniref:Cys-tRNA(Pro) deacylase n=1 Tax=Nonomuraea africana TaxID=46171 RepID=A0ABR9KF91_9ACTN|nr:DUF4145 domain-containing protein [Nonomuraea africana]MBE1560650.1 Cys-tRNA(Pro) deacylase [Nonomuraea africana]
MRPYWLAVCQSCGQALLLESEPEFDDRDPDDLPARPATVLWPADGRPVSAEVPPAVRQELAHARAGLRAGSPASAVVHVRRLLEAVCADHGVTGRTLFHALGELRREGLIDGWLLSWAEELRELGNEAAHLGSRPLGRSEAEDAVELAEAFVDYVYVFSHKYHRFQVRRGAAKSPNIRNIRNVIQETPAIRILRKSQVPFRVHPYPHDPARTKSRAAVADELGISPMRLLKAVILYLGEHAVVAIAPVEGAIDERALARAFGAARARIAGLADVVRIGETIAADVVSPLALPYLPSVLEETSAAASSVYVSSGRHGLELELDPADLVRLTRARTAPIVR